LILEGSAKLSSVPSGGGGAGSATVAAAAAGAAAAAEEEPAEEEKKEEPAEESDEDVRISCIFSMLILSRWVSDCSIRVAEISSGMVGLL
jgi:ribosomal protein L12E/L44/L45/RPP1/RPP2